MTVSLHFHRSLRALAGAAVLCTGAAALTTAVLTAAQAANAAPLEAPVAKSAEPAVAEGADFAALWQQLEKNPYIQEGASNADAKATIYAFFDPNCIFCHLAWKMTQPYLEKGLQVRWIPVAFVMPDSPAKVSWLLTSHDPAAALNAGESGWKKGVRDGGGAFLNGPITPLVTAQIKANEKLFTEFGLDATPSFVYKDAQGHIKTLPGISNQHMIPMMTGLPFIASTDPDLARIPE